MTLANVVKVIGALVAVLVALWLIGEIVSLLASAWFIILVGFGVWWFVRRSKQSL